MDFSVVGFHLNVASLKKLQYDRNEICKLTILQRLAPPVYPTTDLFDISFWNSLLSFRPANLCLFMRC